jgi:hypothetical protein
MARRKTAKPTIDSVTAGCLNRLRQGYVDAAGVLADHLDETEHPLASRVRQEYANWLRCVTCFRSGSWKPRRKLSRWEEIARWHVHLRWRIGRLFKRNWGRFDHSERVYADRNPGTFETLSKEEGLKLLTVAIEMGG